MATTTHKPYGSLYVWLGSPIKTSDGSSSKQQRSRPQTASSSAAATYNYSTSATAAAAVAATSTSSSGAAAAYTNTTTTTQTSHLSSSNNTTSSSNSSNSNKKGTRPRTVNKQHLLRDEELVKSHFMSEARTSSAKGRVTRLLQEEPIRFAAFAQLPSIQKEVAEAAHHIEHQRRAEASREQLKTAAAKRQLVADSAFYAEVAEAKRDRVLLASISKGMLKGGDGGEVLSQLVTSRMQQKLRALEQEVEEREKQVFTSPSLKREVLKKLALDMQQLQTKISQTQTHIHTNHMRGEALRSEVLFTNTRTHSSSAVGEEEEEEEEQGPFYNNNNHRDDATTASELNELKEQRAIKLRHGSARAALLAHAFKTNVVPFGVKELLRATTHEEAAAEEEEQDEEQEQGQERDEISIVGDELVAINLANRSLGDEKGLCLAQALHLCPHLTSLNIAGNRFTDTSCMQILGAILSLKSCVYLNVSDNKLDARSIKPLRQNLQSETCTLEELHLSSSDIDDDECREFMSALQTNTSLKKLVLRHNLIGTMEEYTAVFPSFVTGGTSIARVFETNKTLTSLDLSWNQIRRQSALTLVTSLASNSTLTSLNLANNNIGDVAAQHLAHSLQFNKALTHLDVSVNQIMPRGILVLAHALEVATSVAMVSVVVDGNTLGQLGVQALLRTMRVCATEHRRLHISYQNCNTSFLDRSLLDRSAPRQGEYTLSLEDPYDYCVASILYDVVNSKLGGFFKELKYKARGGGTGGWKKISLARLDEGSGGGGTTNNLAWRGNFVRINDVLAKINKIASVGEDEEQQQLKKHRQELFVAITSLCTQLGLQPNREVKEMLRVVFEHHYRRQQQQHQQKQLTIPAMFELTFRTVFRIVDTDRGGSVDDVELARCLSLLGVAFANDPTLCRDYAKRMICGVDVADSGSLDENEFVRMMFVSYTETIPQSPPPFVDTRTGKPWALPTCGELYFNLSCQRLPPSLDELPSDASVSAFAASLSQHQQPHHNKKQKHAQKNSNSNSNNSKEQKAAMIEAAVTGDMFLTCEQAEMLLIHYPQNKASHLHAVEHFLPQMTTTVEACRFLAQNLSRYEIFDMRRKWGPLFSAITGLGTGHYVLDLSIEADVRAGKRLAQLNALEKNKNSSEHPTRDTSQNGDFENFRNAQLNGKPLLLSSLFFSDEERPPAGRLRFDYVSTNRPVPGIKASNDEGIEKLLSVVFDPQLDVLMTHAEVNTAANKKEDGDDDDDDDVNSESSIEEVDGEEDEGEEGEEEDDEEGRKEEEEAKAKEEEERKRKEEEEETKNAKAKAVSPRKKRLGDLMHTHAQQVKVYVKKAPPQRLAEILDKRQNALAFERWVDFIDTSYSYYLQAHTEETRDVLKQAILRAKAEAGGGGGGGRGHKRMTKEELQMYTQKALDGDMIKEQRLRSYLAADVSYFVKREKKIAIRGAGVVQQVTSAPKSKKKGAQQAPLPAPVQAREAHASSYDQKMLRIMLCVRFEKHLLMLEVYLVYNLFVSTQQVERILDAFRERGAPDDVCVRVLCMLFQRVVDIVRFGALLHKQPTTVKNEVLHRVGVLNALCPSCAEGKYELDLALSDNREMAKLLIRLAMVESSAELVDKQYIPSLMEISKAEWQIPRTWLEYELAPTVAATAGGGGGSRARQSNKGPPRFGWLSFTYACPKEQDRLVMARKELTLYKALAGSRGTFVKGWVGGELAKQAQEQESGRDGRSPSLSQHAMEEKEDIKLKKWAFLLLEDEGEDHVKEEEGLEEGQGIDVSNSSLKFLTLPADANRKL